MRVLFYLPSTTVNWFHDSLVPLIRAAARVAEVHVVIATHWNGTGIRDEDLEKCLDLDQVNWIILDGPDHPSYRTAPDDPADIIAFAQALDADYTFCRSADTVTPGHFPGKVVYLMEGEFAPSLPQSIPRGGRIVVWWPNLFDFGFMPALEDDERTWLHEAIAPCWEALAARAAQASNRPAYLARTGLPADRTIIALPLQYQGPENVFGMAHGPRIETDAFVAQVSEAMGPQCLIAVSVHPMDRRIRTGGVIDRIRAMDPDRVRIVEYAGETYQGEATERLIQHCDGLILAESKAISLGAYYGKPTLRLTHFATADWVNAYTDLAAYAAAMQDGTTVLADQNALRLWYAFHFANNAFVAAETDFAELRDRVERPVNLDRWERALARHNALG